MARIRTIKPEFFRHESLQDLELANPGMYPMMVFEALWGHCDSKGRFEWKPRMLKLDILPFLPFDMERTLCILESAGMLHRYSIDGKEYGLIDTFEKHQRLSGKELTEGEKFPSPPCESFVKQEGSAGEIPESQEGKGMEEEGKGKEEFVSPVRAEIIEIFEFWKSSMGHERSKIDAKRSKQIADALKLGYTADDLKNAITGCTLSAYHMGDNDTGAKYDSLSLILRDAGKIDQFVGFFKSPPVKRSVAPSATIRKPAPENFSARDYGNGGRL